MHLAEPQTNEVFTALVFVAGAFVGLGGSFFASRVNADPASVMRKSLKEPLLVCRPEGTEHTPLAETVRRGAA